MCTFWVDVAWGGRPVEQLRARLNCKLAGFEFLDLEAPVLEVARNLLGCELVLESEANRQLRAKIVETEAYCEGDPASHSCNGRTERSSVMFGPPARWYIYKCYGIHYMINLVCGPEDTGQAVLIRAAEPLQGETVMRENRGLSGVELTNGPGKLAEALGVDKTFNGQSAVPETGFHLAAGTESAKIYESPRVGINVATERPWRFYTDSEYVSRVSQNDAGRCRN